MNPWIVRIGVTSLLGGAYLGCGSDVVQEDGAGGSSSATTSSVSVTASSVASSSSSSSSSTTGGGVTCEDACAYAASCGLPVCNFIDVDCNDPATQCPADCLNAATCEEINALVNRTPSPLTACLGACDLGGGGGGQGGGGSAIDCATCAAQNSCLGGGCQGDTECQAWFACVQDCADPDCYADCNDANPGAADRYEPLYACACTNCDDAADCGTVMDPCNQTGSGGGGTGGSGAAGGNAGGGGATPN